MIPMLDALSDSQTVPGYGERQVPIGLRRSAPAWRVGIWGNHIDTERSIGRIGKFNNPANPVVHPKSVPSVWISQAYENAGT